MTSTARALVLFLGLAAVSSGSIGCTTSHAVVDTGTPVARGCYDASSRRAGAPCDFTETCTASSLCYMGRSGSEYWSCIGGRVVYSDATTPCLRDGGPPPPAWCPSYVAPPAATTTECRTDADCGSSGGTCWPPGDTSGLHASGACPMECDVDAECGTGSICQPLNGGSCSQCRSACMATTCGPWEACGADGHCRPADCGTDGYACPPGSSCGLTGTPADLHGCSIVGCTSDADCGCGACVLGACALGPGRCDLPRP